MPTLIAQCRLFATADDLCVEERWHGIDICVAILPVQHVYMATHIRELVSGMNGSCMSAYGVEAAICL